MSHGVRTVNAADFGQDVVDRTNVERIKQGLSALVVSGSLSASAQAYAGTIATGGYIGHDGPNGSTVQQRDEAAGYTGWDFLAENIATGQTSAAEVLAAWLASSEHRANLLSPNAHEIGVGYANPNGSPTSSYWVEEFGDRPGFVPPPSTSVPALAVASAPTWTAPTGLGHFVANATRAGQPTYFRDFFDSHGGMDSFGFPKEEPKLRNGRWTQRFQAAVFEYHPENDRDGHLPGTQIPYRDYRVQLELLDDEYMKTQGIPLT